MRYYANVKKINKTIVLYNYTIYKPATWRTKKAEP